MVCPTCSGRKEGICLVNRGDQPHEWRMMPCPTCDGIGEIDEEYAARIEAGATMKAERLARGFGLSAEAKRLGVSPVHLCAIEHGRLPRD